MTVELEVTSINGSVLIIAPHQDDESLGCGALIAALSQQGNLVYVVFVTDGGSSHRKSRTWPRERLTKCREAEATLALAALGAQRQPRTFLRLRDAAMPKPGTASYRDAKKKLIDIIELSRPALVVLPWRRDPHCDHRDSWSLCMDALKEAGQSPDCLEYAVWLDEIGCIDDYPTLGEAEKVIMVADDYLALKLKAVEAHRSQLGLLVQDDPQGFVLSPETLKRLVNNREEYWRPCPAQ